MIELSKSSKFDMFHLQELLVKQGFTKVPMVLDRGDFSVRGCIVDVYDLVHQFPIRIEFDLNEIVRLAFFEIHNQRSVRVIEDIKIDVFDKSKVKLKPFVAKEYIEKTIVSEFQLDDIVVHEEFGIGQFSGLVYKYDSFFQGEYVVLTYKGGDKVFVPVDHVDRLHKWAVLDQQPVLSALNNQQWLSKKKKAKQDTLVFVEKLFENYKFRQQQVGFQFSTDTELQLDIEAQFPHELTSDQVTTLAEIKRDMEATKPMDRLLCGDVGYGKTELMVRAALKALENYKQVAILVPTTILAEQHLKTFVQRLKDSPYRIKCLNRFVSKPDQKKIVKEIKQGLCDCVIGTQRLLSKDVIFSDLGLVIVDEEQRFGVRYKEALKLLCQTVDALYVSATPIPRTLYLSLTGSREMSVINTPPQHRKPILTQIAARTREIVTDAIQAERTRSGQVFYVYNNIAAIHQKALFLKQLIPDIRVGITHGRMNESHIKKTILDFQEQHFDVLLTTTIIENGIDIPNANTIILDEVDRFGLAQIHQLRGRVGRSDRQAYAFLLYSDSKTLGQKAQKRLQAVKEYVALGSGYDLALKDLEIRGSGSILGSQQHGHISNVGFSYYCKLLAESVAEKKGQTITTPIHFETKYITISESYIDNPRERLSVYQRFMNIQSLKDVEQIKQDLLDRYGRFDTTMQSVFNYIIDEVSNVSLTN